MTIVMTEVIGTGCDYTVTRTWTADDDCGNTNIEIQVITVVDTPQLFGVPVDVTVAIIVYLVLL